MLKKTTDLDPLFIRTLQWASNKGSDGFKMSELREAIAKNDDEWVWIQRMMLGEINGDTPLIFHLGQHRREDGEYKYFLTGSGNSVLMDYLELKEARESSTQAKYIAIGSLIIATLVGIAQIAIQIYCR